MSKEQSRRVDPFNVAPDLFQPMLEQEKLLNGSGLEQNLIELVKLRVSQINGCAYCIHMHWQEARAMGEAEDRLYLLDAWRETSQYTAREIAALGWTEAMTRVENSRPPDAAYAELRAQFSPREQIALSLVICAINAWNRIAIGFRMPIGGTNTSSAA